MTKRNGQYNATRIFKAERGREKRLRRKSNLFWDFGKLLLMSSLFDVVVGRFCIFIAMYSQTYV
jgi:hypothetical protein